MESFASSITVPSAIVRGDMKVEGYPTDLSDVEIQAGFQRIQIENIEAWSQAGQWSDVAAYVLSPSDILVKHAEAHFGYAAYSHRRWGHPAADNAEGHLSWHTLSGPHADPTLAIGECVVALLEESHPKIIGNKFRQP